MCSEEVQTSNNITSGDHGQVGIGTLVVFIAMVPIAMIAVGILVDTVGFLQATTEDARERSVNKVTNRVEVLDTHGTIGGKKGIDNITPTARPATSSDAAGVNETSIKYLSDDSAVALTNQMATFEANSAMNDSARDVADSDELGLSEVIGDGGSFDVLSSMNDRYKITIDTTAIETSDSDNTNPIDGLLTGEQITLEIISRTDGTTQVILAMPQQLAGKTQNELVEL